MSTAKTVHGASVGILMLETHFPRIPGDLGNAGSWPFSVQYRVVRGVTAMAALNQNSNELLQAFIDGARELIKMGADGITTSCGFLSLMQEELKVAIDVPVAGTEHGSEFTRVILNDEICMDIEKCRTDNVEAERQLLLQHPEVGAIVLECTNMVPYADDIHVVTGLPVYSIHTFVSWFHARLVPRRFPSS